MYKRNTFGHWEADTVVSGKINNYTLKSKYCFVSLAERKTRLYLVKLIPNRKEETVTNAIIELLKDLPKGAVKTITCDRGKEFAGLKRIEEELNTKMYFADPYCAWQKGTNEHSNGLLREFYPKHMDLSKKNEKEVQGVLELLYMHEFFYYNGKYAAAIATMSAGSMLATLTLLSKTKLMPMHAISTEPTSER